eukprot:5275359-Pyramimonas_sp.AAC.1
MDKTCNNCDGRGYIQSSGYPQQSYAPPGMESPPYVSQSARIADHYTGRLLDALGMPELYPTGGRTDPRARIPGPQTEFNDRRIRSDDPSDEQYRP